MIKLFKRLKYLSALEHENEMLKARLQSVEQRLGDPKEIVARIFSKGISWYDWNDLPLEEHRKAYKDAQFFLESEIIHNIKNQIVAVGCQRAALEEEHNTNKIRDFQMMIAGIELLSSTLAEIYDPDQPQKDLTNAAGRQTQV